MKDRTNKILEILTRNGRAEVNELSAALGVSQVTIRKDLDKMAAKGLVTKEHGYAILNNSDDISNSIACHYEEKLRIAVRAAELVHDGDTIMIENGSCCALLAKTLTETHKNLTIVTNSAFIVDYIRGCRDFQIVLLGGIFQHDSHCLVGPMVRDGAMNYNVDFLFAGTDGFSRRAGFTNKDQMRAQALRDMAESAEEVVFLTESSKFQTRGTVPLHLRECRQTVITDSRISREARENLQTFGITLITVE